MERTHEHPVARPWGKGIILILGLVLSGCGKNISESPDNLLPPKAPPTILASAYNAYANIEWRTPDTTIQDAPTGYTAFAVQDTSKRCTTSRSRTDCVIQGLTNNTPYSFVVRAFNAAGASPLSDPSPYVIPFDSSYFWSLEDSTTLQNALYAVVWGNDQLVAVGSDGVIVSSEDGTQWEKRTSGTTERLLDLVWNGQRYIAGGEKGALLTSTNGMDWSKIESNTLASIYSLVWTGSQFFAHAGPGRLLTSSNGTVWTTLQPDFSLVAVKDIAWGNSQLVAVGDSGTILTSSNGTTWSTPSSGTTNYLISICWTGSQFIAVGERGTVLTSIDGSVWVNRSLPWPIDLGFVLWANNQLLAVGSFGATITSPDGLSWTIQNVKPHYLFSVAWTGTHYAAVGNDIFLSP